ncbi:hypothetical protein FZ103_15895 [Streptomonospora sp. PA3]|uniref:DUF6082 family protein n=1 Tax=Streptomonospora sp. PA3 TaxID=2607326 RepID=UPI0012DE23AF|nr:hypothetical protein [Streptomonospora sp. PA3]
MRRRADRGAIGVRYLATILIIVLASVALVISSPFALMLFGGARSEWERLSFIGQTYGAAAALISVFALVGIVLTLVYQARDSHRATEETRRQAMSDLLRMAMEDPDLDECWGPVPDDEDPKVRKQQLYTNMIVSQWSSAFETGALPESRLRAVAAEMFQGEVGYSYWTKAREAASMTEGTRRERRFVEIVDEVYRQTSAPAPQGARSEAEPQPAASRRRWKGYAAAGAASAAAGAVAAGVAVARRREASVPLPKRGLKRWFAR